MRHLPTRGLIAAVTLVAPLPALAQSADLDQMQQGLSMLELSVQQAFITYGIEADPQELSLSQLAIIHSILTGSDNEGTKEQRLETALRR